MDDLMVLDTDCRIDIPAGIQLQASDDVPIPTRQKKLAEKKEKRERSKTRNKYDFSNIKIGDSVFFPSPWKETKEYFALVRHAFRHGWKPVMRSDAAGVRVWRTADGA